MGTVHDLSVIAFVPAAAAGFSEGVAEHVISEIRGGPSTLERIRTVATANLLAPRIRRAMRPAHVVHFPLTVPAPRPARNLALVQSLLDVQHLELPHLFTRSELAYRRQFYEGAAKTANAVITISEFAKTRMIELLGIPASRIRVAHLGVDSAKFTPNRGEREEFVLYPARGWPHKNHARLIAAMDLVRKDRPEMRLVLTGGGLHALGELPEWVDRRGLVSNEELRSLYRRASVLAFPSLYEGFGLPPLEAMASGCPVAASDTGSIPEVCGDAAELFDPTDVEAISAGILLALQRGPELTEAGLRQVTNFTWERCRDIHADIYRGVA
jgi:glycosyltransferase involved in cell wall biosynthesis